MVGATYINNILYIGKRIQFKLTFNSDLSILNGLYIGDYYENSNFDNFFYNYNNTITNLQMNNGNITVYIKSMNMTGIKADNSLILNVNYVIISKSYLPIPYQSNFSLSLYQNNYKFDNNTQINYNISQGINSTYGTAYISNIIYNDKILHQSKIIKFYIEEESKKKIQKDILKSIDPMLLKCGVHK